MSSVRRRSDGRLFFELRHQGIRCRELTELDDTPANRAKMEKVLAKIDSEIAVGTFDYRRYFPGSKMVKRFAAPKEPRPGDPIRLSRGSAARLEPQALPLFREFVEAWLPQKQIEWRHSHRVTVESGLKSHLLPAFGHVPVDQITREQILALRALMASKKIRIASKKTDEDRTISASTINKIIGILRMILDEAAMQFGIKNPCLTIKRLKVQRIDIEPFNLEEVQLILDRTRKDYRPYLSFRFFTGVRSGEAHGLKWKHIDFERRQVLIRESFTYGRTEYTKNDGSQRELQMSQPVLDALMLMKPQGYDKDPQSFGERYVFSSNGKKPLDNTNFNDRVWKPLLRNLGLKYRRPYQMRHTCATLWLASGESPEWIARQLGHTTTEMLFRTYSRYVPNFMRRDGTAFDTLVAGIVTPGSAPAANDDFLLIGKLDAGLKRGTN